MAGDIVVAIPQPHSRSSKCLIHDRLDVGALENFSKGIHTQKQDDLCADKRPRDDTIRLPPREREVRRPSSCKFYKLIVGHGRVLTFAATLGDPGQNIFEGLLFLRDSLETDT